MKIIGQLSIILAVYLTGVGIENLSGLPVPGSIIAMILMLLLLYLKIIRVEYIREVSDFMLNNMMLFFIPATVSIMDSYHVLDGVMGNTVLVIIISTLLTLIPTAMLVQWVAKKKDNRVKAGSSKNNEINNRDINE